MSVLKHVIKTNRLYMPTELKNPITNIFPCGIFFMAAILTLIITYMIIIHTFIYLYWAKLSILYKTENNNSNKTLKGNLFLTASLDLSLQNLHSTEMDNINMAFCLKCCFKVLHTISLISKVAPGTLLKKILLKMIIFLT